MKNLLIILLSCLSLDCASLGPLPFHYTQNPSASTAIKTVNIWIDQDFSETDKLAMDDAINQWNFALNGSIKLQVVSTNFNMEPDIINRVLVQGDGWLFLKINGKSPFVHDTGAGHTLAFVNEVGSNGNRIYFVRDRFLSDAVHGISLHEIGHLLGAQHDDVYLMKPHYNWYDYRCVDKHTMEEVAAYQHISMDKVNYCVYGEAGYNPFEKLEKAK